MSFQTLSILLNILFIVGGLMTLYSLYFFIIAFFGFKKRKVPPAAPATTRFAVVVAARNEAAVIGQLVDSLANLNYPKDMYDIIVAPNNCTDDTEAIAAWHGANIFHPEGPISCKGQVLAQISDQIIKTRSHDAICVFDADNLVHPDFLQRMNDARAQGFKVAQGFRDSKNPADTVVSTCYSVTYWIVNRFYNGGREALGLSGLVNGSGFMVCVDLLEKLGGFRTSTMTEDYEFSAQCVLHGEKVHYVHEAIIYDEQPLTFFQSWKQRRRWSTGNVQGMELYAGGLLRTAIKRRCWVCFDMALTYLTPIIQLVSLVLGAASAVLAAYRIFEFDMMPVTQVLMLVILAAVGAMVFCSFVAALVVWLDRASFKGTVKGILLFALFILSSLPISIISLFRKQKVWEATAHTRAMALSDMTKR
ncbi:MAG: glycosyltransferase family 2 protein [Ruminococcaceae bacterium]|nr:glycosyltransferase family 2 protein [Oscillospiraceae bacterium]